MRMKKISVKAAAAAIACAAAVSVTAFSAGAANYPNDPKYNPPDTTVYGPPSHDGNPGGSSNSNSNSNSGTTPSGTAAAPAASPSVLTSTAVTNAINNAAASGSSKANISMASNSSGSVTLREDTVAAIAKGKVEVDIQVKPCKDSLKPYTVGISPDMITDVNGAVNVGMLIEKTSELRTVNGVYVPTGAVIIKPVKKGRFGMTLKVTLSAEQFKDMSYDKHLYAVYSNGSVVRISDDAIVFNNDGTVTVKIDNGDASLVISDKDIEKADRKAKNMLNTGSADKKALGSNGVKSAAVLGTADLAALSAAGIISQKKKKKK